MDLGVKGLRQPRKPLGCKTVCWVCYISLYIGNCRLKILKVVSNKRRTISQDLKKKGRTSLLRYITDKVNTWPVDYLCFHNVNYWEYFCSRTVFNCVPKVIRDCIQLVFLYFALWLVQKTRASLSQSIIYKIKTNHVLVARVFPRFRQSVFPRFRHSGWFYFEFSLVIKDIFLYSDWLLW